MTASPLAVTLAWVGTVACCQSRCITTASPMDPPLRRRWGDAVWTETFQLGGTYQNIYPLGPGLVVTGTGEVV